MDGDLERRRTQKLAGVVVVSPAIASPASAQAALPSGTPEVPLSSKAGFPKLLIEGYWGLSASAKVQPGAIVVWNCELRGVL